MNQKMLLKKPYSQPLLSIDNMPGTYNTRTFIGGNYACQFVVLLEIQKYVRELSKGFFIPVLAADYNIKQGEERNSCLRLLHNCRFAIFELTTPSGQMIEIDAAKNYGINFIVICNSYNQNPFYAPGINMTDVKSKIILYRSLAELESIISDYLIRWKNSLM